MKKIFYKFLKDEGIWDLYWERVKEGQENGRRVSKIEKAISYIVEAFDWDLHGDLSYWAGKNLKWRIILKEYRK